jgi:hypothetical protein
LIQSIIFNIDSHQGEEMKSALRALHLLLSLMLLTGCATPQNTQAESTLSLSTTPSHTPLPPAATPTRAPTPIGGSNGLVVTQRMNDFYILNLDTGEKKIFLSLDEVEPLLPKDRTFEAYGFESTSLQADISPDLTKAKISVCSKLDRNLDCIYEDFIYDILSNSVASLNSSNWEWSPEGSKLAKIERIYVGKGSTRELLSVSLNIIDSDGSNLQTLAPVADEYMRFKWHPDGQSIYVYYSKSNFREIRLDGSIKEKDSDILKDDDLIACLDISSDGKKLSFAVNSEAANDQFRIYIANSDLTSLSLITESNADSHYNCEINLSPSHNYILLKFNDKIVGSGSEYDPLYRGFETETGISFEVPQYTTYEEQGTIFVDQGICGWSPDSKLVYINKNSLRLIDLTTAQERSISTGYGCPEPWLLLNYSDPAPETAWVMRFGEDPGCHAGQTINDAEDSSVPGHLDILRVSTVIEESKLIVTLTLRDAPSEIITLHEFTDTTNLKKFYYNIGIDVDNNVQTGSKIEGQQGENASILVSIFQREGKLYGQVFTAKSGSNELFDSGSDLLIDKESNTISFYGEIPKISPSSYLKFSAYSFDPYVHNHVCE